MLASFAHITNSNYVVPHHGDGELCARVQAEFVEMPGLRLTLAQAARLFSIESNQCQRVLDTLVLAGHLVTDGKTFTSPRIGCRSV